MNSYGHLTLQRDATPSSNAPSASYPVNSDSGYDLNLLWVRKGEEPLPLRSPLEAAQFAHARFLAADKSEDFWEERRSRMNPEPFRFD